jgi:disulfide oxidoreductase YuzD
MRFGEAVDIEYVDMADPTSQAQFPEVSAAAADQNLPYPLVAINGRLRAAGSAHYYRILPFVEEVLEADEVEVSS